MGARAIRAKLRLGDWLSRSNNTVYQADTDGFVVAWTTAAAAINGYTDNSNPPTTERQRDGDGDAGGGNGSSIFVAVKKNDYWKIANGTVVTVYWIPLE